VATVKVTRDGVVTVDGTNVGHVVKEMRQGMFQTILGASMSGGGTPYWVPFAADGTQLNEYGYDTRKRAVDRIVKHAQPLTVERVEVEHPWGYDQPCITAGVRFQGHYFGVSRYPSENAWVVDFYCTPDSICPVWSNGTGTRVTAARVLKDDMAAAVTAAAEAAGLWPVKI
jgi:hypothetical protein